jgi:hypothetical protein
LATCAFAFDAGFGLGLRSGLFDFGFAGGDIGCQGFLEQIALFCIQRFALGAKADTAQVGQF